MITLHIEVPYASFRKSFARSFAETYPLPPPATVYGMLLSLVGEHFRRRHEGVRLAFAYKRMLRIATTLRKLSRFKYGSIENYRRLLKEEKDTRQIDYVETLCGIELLCWIDSREEMPNEDGSSKGDDLERRLGVALQTPHEVERSGVLYLGLSDDAVNEVSLWEQSEGAWHRLLPSNTGTLELPVWVDHVGAANTRWRRYNFEEEAAPLTSAPGSDEWQWTRMVSPQNINTN